MEITGIMSSVYETSMSSFCGLLLVLCAVLSFTAGRKWKIIREQESRIEKLEIEAIEKEELLKILNIKLN